MEHIVFLSAVIAVLIVITLIGIRNDRRARRHFKEKMRRSYGKLPEYYRTGESNDYIRSYFEHHRTEDCVDDITWHDIGMDAVFARINYCRSAAGEQMLYHVLRNPACGVREGFEEQVAFAHREAAARIELQSAFEDMRQTSKYSAYDHLDNLDMTAARSNGVHFAMLCLMAICVFGSIFLRFSLFFPALVVLLVMNLINYYREKKEVDAYYATFEYVLRLIHGAQQVRAVLKKTAADALFHEEAAEIDSGCAAMQSFRRGSFLVMTPQVSNGNPLDLLFDYFRIFTHADLIRFNNMYRHLITHVADVERLIRATGMIEVIIAAAAFRASMKERYCLPEEAEGTRLEIEGAFHPLLEEAVANNITCARNVLLTGSNASGKSTFLKTVAICALLAQTIRTVPAKRYRAPRYRIYSSMALSDNLSGGESYYIVEIKSLKRILDAGASDGPRVICFIDEVLRGTNTLERIAASAQVLKQFASANVQCFAATHDGELTEILKDLYDNYHFDGTIEEGDVRFDYLLKEGPATTRNAIRLLDAMGYDDTIVKEAEAMAGRFLATGVWTL